MKLIAVCVCVRVHQPISEYTTVNEKSVFHIGVRCRHT